MHPSLSPAIRTSQLCVTFLLLGACTHRVAAGPAVEAPRPSARAPAPATRILPVEAWREDLRVLARELPLRHREPFRKLPRAQFEAEVAALDARLGELSDDQVIVALAGLVARIGDGHTRLTLPEPSPLAFRREHTPTPAPVDPRLQFHHLPLRLAGFEEGVFVVAATEDHADWVGARLLRIGAREVTDALARARTVAHGDNPLGVELVASALLGVPEVLHALEFAPDASGAQLTLRLRTGEERTVFVPVLAVDARPELVTVASMLSDPPLELAHREVPIWMQALPDRRALYVGWNEVSDAPGQTLAAFSAQLATALEAPNVERVVVDLRHNPGGNGNLARPVVLALLRSRQNAFGHLFVLIGRETFSAAQLTVNQLELWTEALFVGEPTGASPSGVGDSKKLKLPRSGLTVRIASISWRDWTPTEGRQWTPPDLPVPPRAEDHFAGRDAALEAALGFQARSTLELIGQVGERGGAEPLDKLLYRLTADPRRAAENSEPWYFEAAQALGRGPHRADAKDWLEYAAAQQPASARLHRELGRVLLEANERPRAIVELTRALELDPTDAGARSLLVRTGASPPPPQSR